MAFEVVAMEDEQPMPRGQLLLLLAKAAGKSIGQVIKEEWNRVKHEEFWSDPCWAK